MTPRRQLQPLSKTTTTTRIIKKKNENQLETKIPERKINNINNTNIYIYIYISYSHKITPKHHI